MDKIMDEIVQVRVSDAVAAASATSVNTAAVVGVTTKDEAATQVLYGQDAVKQAYETGTKRVIIIDPSVTTAASGDVVLKLGTTAVSTVAVKESTTVRSLVKSLAANFSCEGYSAQASSTSLTITSDAYGATASEDGAFSIVYNSTGFSGSPTNTDGTEGSDLVKVTESFFEEEYNPGRIVCIPVGSDPTGANIADTLDGAVNLGKDANNRDIDFYNVIIRLGEGATKSSVVSLVSALESWCKTNFRTGHVEVQDRTVAEDAMAELSANPPTRVAVYFHKETSGKSLAAALVSDRCGHDPARGTWAHKTLNSITPDATSRENFIDAEELGLNVYVKVAGVNRTYFGTTGSKTKFIDSVVKKDWLKFRTQEAIFNILGSANNGDGVDFNDDGINSVVASMTDIFSTAQDTEHRYVLPDSWDITAPLYKEIPQADKNVRNLPRVRATFSIQESIHTVKTVELQVI